MNTRNSKKPIVNNRLSKSPDLAAMYDEKFAKMSEEFNLKINDMKKILNEKDVNINILISKINTLEQKVNKIERNITESQEIDQLNHDFDQRCMNLMVNGLPKEAKIDINAVTTSLANCVGLNPNDISPSFIARPKGNSNSLCLTFRSTQSKDEFLHNYRKVSGSLTTRKISINEGNNQRIYIQQDMSKNQYEIFKSAMSFYKDKKIRNFNLARNGFIITQINSVKQLATSVNSLQSILNANQNGA